MDLGEVRPLRRRLARARHARLRVDDDVDAGNEKTGGQERRQGQQRGRRIAARVGHESGAGNGVARQFGQAIDHAVGEAVRLRIPAGTRGGVPEPERAREVDDPHSALGQRGPEFRRRLVGQGKKDHVGVVREHVVRERRDLPVPESGECGQRTRRAAARAGRHRGRDRHARMAGEQPEQFLAGIAGRARDRHAHGFLRRRRPGHARGGRGHVPSLGRSCACNCMHEKEYLYTIVSRESINMDV